jgi:hypothetical protein
MRVHALVLRSCPSTWHQEVVARHICAGHRAAAACGMSLHDCPGSAAHLKVLQACRLLATSESGYAERYAARMSCRAQGTAALSMAGAGISALRRLLGHAAVMLLCVRAHLLMSCITCPAWWLAARLSCGQVLGAGCTLEPWCTRSHCKAPCVMRVPVNSPVWAGIQGLVPARRA